MKNLTLKKYKKVDKQTEKIKHFFEKENFKDFSLKIEIRNICSYNLFCKRVNRRKN